MCSCGTDCVDAPVETYVETDWRDGEEYVFVGGAPVQTNDLTYEFGEQEYRPVVIGERAYRLNDLTPEQRAIYDQAYAYGTEDGVRTVEAVIDATKVAMLGPEEPSSEEITKHNLRALVYAVNTNGEAMAEGFESAADAFESLVGLFMGIERRVTELEGEPNPVSYLHPN